jgi:hypothetical protein
VIATLLAAEKRMTKPKQALAVRVTAGSVAKARTFDPDDFERRRRPWLDFLDGVTGKAARNRDPVDWKTVFDSNKALTENRDQFEETLKIGYTLLRDMMLILAAGPNSPVVNVDLSAQLKAWSEKLGLQGVGKLKGGLDEAYRLQIRNVNQQLGLDALAIQLVASPSPLQR